VARLKVARMGRRKGRQDDRAAAGRVADALVPKWMDTLLRRHCSFFVHDRLQTLLQVTSILPCMR
jgi:hypothetical protein